MIKYEYKGKQYDWLSDIRKDIWETDRVVFGAWDDLVKEQFGVTEVMVPDPVTPPYEPTDEELARQIRDERDRKLEETDWCMMPDYPADPETLEVVKNYRKALRDITLQSGFLGMLSGLWSLECSVRILKRLWALGWLKWGSKDG